MQYCWTGVVVALAGGVLLFIGDTLHVSKHSQHRVAGRMLQAHWQDVYYSHLELFCTPAITCNAGGRIGVAVLWPGRPSHRQHFAHQAFAMQGGWAGVAVAFSRRHVSRNRQHFTVWQAVVVRVRQMLQRNGQETFVRNRHRIINLRLSRVVVQ